MEPQFVINVGFLDNYKLKAKDFLNMLGIDLKKAKPAGKYLNCPKCGRTQQDVYFVYHKYKDFQFGINHEDRDADYRYTAININLCICGCLYYTGSKVSSQSFVEKFKKRKRPK